MLGRKEKFSDNHFHNFFRLMMFSKIFLSLQVKQWAIITYKYGVYKFSYELLIDLRLKTLGK